MRGDADSTSGWRDAASYQPLLHADRSLIAWEWLRRDPLYRAAASGALAGGTAAERSLPPGRFGLVVFESCERRVPDARPLWRKDVHPYVLAAHPVPWCGAGDSLDLGPLADFVRLVGGADGEHLLLCDGLRTIRIDAPAGTFGRGAVGLAYDLAGLASANPPLLTLRRLLALTSTGRFARSVHAREVRSKRWVLMLRACDALAAGADQRDIAEALLSRSAGGPRWRIREPSVRSRVQRLVRASRRMASGGYRGLLR